MLIIEILIIKRYDWIFWFKKFRWFEDNENKNIHSKSLNLAPFNSSMTYDNIKDNDYDYNNKSLIIKNNVIKFSAKVKELNRNYELNNNGEIDNGIVISPKDSIEKKK